MARKKGVLIKTLYGSFQCVFEPEKEMGGYTAEAIGVQGAVSWGKTLTEAKRMIKDAIEGSVEARTIVQTAARISVADCCER